MCMSGKMSKPGKFYFWITGLFIFGGLLIIAISPGISEDTARVQRPEDSVVRIRSSQADEDDPEEEAVWQTGAGFILKKHGEKLYILTVTHVVKGASEIYVEFKSRQDHFVPAKVLFMEGRDSNGIALIVVEKFPANARPLLLSDEVPRKLQAINAIGFPRTGAAWNSSRGFVTGNQGKSVVFSARVDGGNSGGPLLNREGRVVGIVASVKGKYGYATRAEIIRATLKGWGVELPESDRANSNIRLRVKSDVRLCPGAYDCYAAGMQRLKDGGYAIILNARGKGRDEAWSMFVQLDKQLKIVFRKDIKSKKGIYTLWDLKVKDNRFWICGVYRQTQYVPEAPPGFYRERAMFMALDGEGKTLFRTITPPDPKKHRRELYSLAFLPSGEIILLGSVEYFTPTAINTEELYIIANKQGEFLRNFRGRPAGARSSEGKEIRNSPTGNIIAAGNAKKSPEGKDRNYAWVYRLGASGQVLQRGLFTSEFLSGVKMFQGDRRGNVHVLLYQKYHRSKRRYPGTILLSLNNQFKETGRLVLGHPEYLLEPFDMYRGKDGAPVIGGNLSSRFGRRSQGIWIYRGAAPGRKAQTTLLKQRGLTLTQILPLPEENRYLITGSSINRAGDAVGYLVVIERVKTLW